MPSRSSDPFGAALEAALGEVLAAVAALDSERPRVLIDGRSGSGKTTMAALLAGRWPLERAPRVVAMDDFYPGWDGLAAASRMLVTGVLEPHTRGLLGLYRRWDWAQDRPRSMRDAGLVPPDRPLIVEGCGALTPLSLVLVDLAVWVDAPEPSRRARALERDGDGYAPHWERWARQEEEHIAAHRPHELADLAFDLP
ncbi:AAA family ATPase [Microbacterium petrolearium]